METVLKSIKKHVAIVAALALLVTIFSPAIVQASEVDQLSELEDLLTYELGEENMEVEYIEISADEVIIEVAVEDPNGEELLTALEFTPGASYMTLFVEAYNDEGVLEYSEFIVDLSDVEDYAGVDGEPLELIFEDVDTGEIFEYHSEYGVLACFGCIFLALATGTVIIGSLLAAGTAVVVGGVVLLSAALMMLMPPEQPPAPPPPPPPPPPLPSEPPSQGPSDPSHHGYPYDQIPPDPAQASPRLASTITYYHFEAVRYNGDLFVGAGLTLDAAAARLRNRQDTWSISQQHAQEVAALASGTLFLRTRLNPFGPSNNANLGRMDNLYYDHFRPNPRTNSYAFFGNTPTPGRRR